MDSIVPVVDLSKYVNGNEAEKAVFATELGRAYEEVGFVAVKNHGISDELVNGFYDEVKKFFFKEASYKSEYEIEGLAGQRGYTSFGKEHAKGSDVPDLKEFWQLGQEVTDGDSIKSEYPDNVKVSDMAYFNEVGRNLYQAFEESGKHLLCAIAQYLNLEVDYFNAKVHNGNSILRAIHYPPITQEPESAIRAEEHEDINLITLLVGASAEGLQLLTKEGEWMPVMAEEGQIIVNVGDMLQRLTNNRLRSTTHRVVNPPKELWHTSRFSIPFFLHPRSEMDLTCLDSCIDEGKEADYTPITAGEYLRERLIEIGLLKK